MKCQVSITGLHCLLRTSSRGTLRRAQRRSLRLALAGLLALNTLVLAFLLLDSESRAWEGQGRNGAPAGSAARAALQAQAIASTGPYTNCRFGVGKVYHPVISYNVSSLNLGWYVDWGTRTSPSRPGGVEYVQVLRVNPAGYQPSGSVLALGHLKARAHVLPR